MDDRTHGRTSTATIVAQSVELPDRVNDFFAEAQAERS